MLRSIRSKVLLAILTVTLATALAITLVFYFKSARTIEKDYTKNLYGRLEQTAAAFDNSLKEIYYINVNASCDEGMTEEIMTYQSGRDSAALEHIAEILRTYRSRNKDISSMYLLLPNEMIAVTSEDYPVYKKDIPKEDIEVIQAFEQIQSVPGIFQDMVHASSKMFSYVQTIRDKEGHLLGYVMANIDERTLYYEYLDDLYDGKVTEALILNGDQQIVSARDYTDMGSTYQNEEFKIPKNHSAYHTGKESSIHISCQALFSECTFFMVIKKSEILKDLRGLQLFFTLILISFLGVALMLAYCITKAMYQPIKNLTTSMEHIANGDLDHRVEITTQDEIGALSKEFNTMLDRIEELIGCLIEEEALKKDAELEALQYQITPHFMYNTLNSIKYAALIRGEKELGGLLGDFVELLQASINKKGTFLTVSDEIHILENYIHLQEFRYGGSFQVNYDIAAEAKGCLIPRLLLQPLVENSILHGIDMKGENGCITICAEVEEQVLTLRVKDNGRGMTEEQIEMLLNSKAEKTNGFSAIGVPNIKERLQLHYGKEAGLTYKSSKKGTIATIFLPVRRSFA